MSATDEVAKQRQLAELLNVLEISCALQVKGVFTGVSRELLTEYLDSVLRLLNDNEDAKNRLTSLVEAETTFKYIGLYLQKIKKYLGHHRQPL